MSGIQFKLPLNQKHGCKFVNFQMNHTIQFVELPKQINIAYVDQGPSNKPVLLFIHGLANYLHVWDQNITTLQKHFRCIAIDLPGNGLSSRQDIEYSINFFAEVIPVFLMKLHIKKATLIGHSMGGQIALQVSLSYPQFVEKLILFAPAGFEYYSPHEAILFKSAISFGNFLNMDEVHITQSITSSFFKPSPVCDKIIQELNQLIQQNDRVQYRKMLDYCINSMLDHQIFNELKNVHSPTLVFFGENDMLIPNRFLHPVSTKDIASKACKEMKHAQLNVYPNTGHFVQIERSKEVNEQIIAFLN